jgi:hypothetical protein
MFDALKKWWNGTPVEQPAPIPELVEVPKVRKPRKPRAPKPAVPALTAKELATAAGQPYIAITKVELDPKDINNGSFELDWNDKFVLNLVKQGYKFRQNDTDAEIVDRWFQTVCRNIALEVYEQEQADPAKRDDVRIIAQRDLGNGFTEVS